MGTTQNQSVGPRTWCPPESEITWNTQLYSDSTEEFSLNISDRFIWNQSFWLLEEKKQLSKGLTQT